MKSFSVLGSRVRAFVPFSRITTALAALVLVSAGVVVVGFSHSSSASNRIFHVVANHGSENPTCPATDPCSLSFALSQSRRSHGIGVSEYDMGAGSYLGTFIVNASVELVADGPVTLEGDLSPAVIVESGVVATIGGGSLVTITDGTGFGSAVGAGGIINYGNLTLSNVTVTGNTDSNADEGAGGIFNEGTMSISNSFISSNTASYSDACAGGIINDGTLTLSSTDVTNNECNGDHQFGAGGILNDGDGLINNDASNSSVSVTLENSSAVTSNTCDATDAHTIASAGGILNGGSLSVSSSLINSNGAGMSGGGLYNLGTSVTITDSRFDSNSAQRNGGAIDNGDDGYTGSMSITGSIFTNNNSTVAGGAIVNGDDGGTGTLTMSDSTLYDNSSTSGGAIENGDGSGTGTATISFSTFDGNQASTYGPGIENALYGGSGTLTITHSTFIDDSGGTGDAIDNGIEFPPSIPGTASVTVAGDLFGEGCANYDSIASWTDNGYNAGVDDSCENNGTGDVVSSTVGSDVGSLSGTPGTLALRNGNAGIALIPNPTSGLCPVATDESGSATATDKYCDAGAVEDPSVLPQSITFTSTPPTQALTGAHYTPTATAPGGTVDFTVDTATTTNSACSITSGVVSFDNAGTCVIDANQVGNSTYNAAPQVQQTITVTQGITVTYELGSASVTGSVPTQDNVASGGQFTVASGASLTRSGYTFAGWSDGNATYQSGATYIVGSSPVVLTAQWTPIVVSSAKTSPPLISPPPKLGGALSNADFGPATSVTYTSGSESVSSGVTTSSGSSAYVQLNVPAGAFSTPTTVSVYPIQTSSLTPPHGNSYILSFAVSWVNGSGESPNSNKPLTMTIFDSSLTAGEVIYELDASGDLVQVGKVATPAPVPPSVTITFDSDPVFVIEAPLPPRVTTIKFARHESSLNARVKSTLASLAKKLTKGETLTITSDATSGTLATKRAEAVAKFLNARVPIHWKIKTNGGSSVSQVQIRT